MPAYGPEQRPTVGTGAPNTDNGTNITIGSRFTFARAGRITKIRYYRRSSMSSTIHLNIWDSGGIAAIGAITDTQGAGTNGYQTVSLPTPRTVAAGSTYTLGLDAVTTSFLFGAIETNTDTADVHVVRADLSSVLAGAFPTTGNNATVYIEPIYEPEIASGAGSTTVTFTATATGTAGGGPGGTATVHFTATAVGSVVVIGAASTSFGFRAVAQRYAAWREWGRWSQTGDADLVTGTIVPTPGAVLVVLYALRIDGTETLLAADDSWGNNGVNPITAIVDDFGGSSEWRGWPQGNFTTFGTPGVPHSNLVAGAWATVGPTPASGRITIHPINFPGLAKTAYVNVFEVVNAVRAEFGGGDIDRPPQPTSSAALPSSFTFSLIDFGLAMADVAPTHPTITAPARWRSIRHDVTPSTPMEIATAVFPGALADTEAQALGHVWSAMPLGAYATMATTVRVVSATTSSPVPAPFAEFLVEFQDATGAWVDITCDARTADVNHGRQDIAGNFDAATMTLVLANFDGVYSPWPPDSIWQRAGPRRTAVPIRVNMMTEDLVGGAIMRVLHPLFTGTTDAIHDSWPGTLDAMVTVTASDAFKSLARVDTVEVLGGPDGKTPVEFGYGETSGARIRRWLDLAGWQYTRPDGSASTALDLGTVRMAASTMAGNALTEMQRVTFAEGLGVLYVRADGVLVFRQRDAVMTDPRQTSTQATFTDDDDDPPGACYSDIGPVVDETSVYNVAQVGSKNGLVQTYADPTSVAWFGRRTYPSQTDSGLIEWNDDLGVAILVVYTHADNEKRVDSITINAGFDPTVWRTACSLQLLDRVRVVRHYPGDPGGYVLDENLLIEGVHHHLEGTGKRVPGLWSTTYDTVRAIPEAAGVSFCKWDRGAWDRCSWGL